MTRRRTWAAGLALAASLAYVLPATAAEPVRPARVTTTDGLNLRVRALPDAQAPIVKRLGPGWRMNVIGEPVGDGRWLRVEHSGTTGYVAAEYVSFEGAAEGPGRPAAPAAAVTVAGGQPRPGFVTNTDGANLRMRSAPEMDAPIIKRLGPAWRLGVLGAAGADGRWLQVQHDGAVGYVAAEYIAYGEPETRPPAAPVPAAPAPETPRPTAPPRAGWIANTDGANLRLRAQPSVEATVIKPLAPGWRVTILEGPITAAGTSWVRIEHAGASGFVAAAYVAGSVAGGGDAGPAPVVVTAPPAPASPSKPTALPRQGRVVALEPSRLRAAPSLDAVIITPLPPGALIETTGREASSNGYRWLSVRVFGRDGWMVADVLGAAPAGKVGQDLAGEALSQIGRPYVWGGETPTGGFDCSGLLRYVIKTVTGIDVTHVLARQAETGAPVDREDLQVGDLVFFRDTYKPGLSHAGFYVGDGQFVSAQNEKVGVVRAQLDNPYWKSRWYGARRIVE